MTNKPAQMPVYSYTTTIETLLPTHERIPALQAINAAHGYVPQWDEDAPKHILDAHYKLHGVQQQSVTIDIFADGTRRIRGAIPRDAAELEAENKALREAARNVYDAYDNAPLVTMPIAAHEAMSALHRVLRGLP